MPRLRYRCTLPQTRDCHKDQYINSAHYYKRLLPIWETHKNYAILREAHPEYERIHNHNRHRYRISPDCLELRPKRIGAAWQQLRVSATVIEWLRVCFHQGWIGKSGHQNPPNAPPNASSSKPAELANASADAAAGSPNADPAPAPHHYQQRSPHTWQPGAIRRRQPGRIRLDHAVEERFRPRLWNSRRNTPSWEEQDSNVRRQSQCR